MAGPGKYANGQYSILNAGKYAGNKVPYYRSGWEHAFMRFCDNHPSIVNWASEAIQIPYRNPLTGKQSIYVPDFFIVYQNKKGKRKAELIEIKPKKQTKPPKPNPKHRRRFLKEVKTWGINEAKWKAAEEFCENKGWKWQIITEDTLTITK